MKKLCLVFSGYNQRAVVAYLRTLEKSGVEYVIAALGSDDTIFKSTYRDKVIFTRPTPVIDIKMFERIMSLIGKDKSVFVAPSSEYLNRYLLKERVLLEKMGYKIPLIEETLYSQISDKESFQALCDQYEIKTPKLVDLTEKYNEAIVAKPRKYVDTSGNIYSPIIITSQAELDRFISEHRIENFYYQEYINGESYYLLYYFSKNGSVQKLSQRNLAQQHDGKSVVAATTSDIHNLKISTEYEEMFRKLGFRGLVMVEIKKNEDNEFIMIEANPRFWGPSQLFIDSGCNLFNDFLRDYGLLGASNSKHNITTERYFWNGGYKSTLDSGEEIKYYCDPLIVKDNIQQWMASDVYNRGDTTEIYNQELQGD